MNNSEALERLGRTLKERAEAGTLEPTPEGRRRMEEFFSGKAQCVVGEWIAEQRRAEQD